MIFFHFSDHALLLPFAAGYRPRMPDLPASLDRFRAIVFVDPTLQRQLRQAPDRASFIALVVDRSHAYGCALDAAEIEAALAAAARDWTLRWITR
jgi:hypothetical protein